MSPTPALHSLSLANAKFSPLDKWNGSEAVLYRSSNGRRVAGSFHHSGHLEFTTPCDEFMYVVQGTIAITTADGRRHEKAAGDVLYLEKGLSIVVDYSDDFQNVAMLINDGAPVDY